MVENIGTSLLVLVMSVAAHVVLNAASREETGILGTNITLEFRFNVSITPPVAFYVNNHIKIAEYEIGKVDSAADEFFPYSKRRSAFLHIKNLTLNHSGYYFATLFTTNVPTKSEIVQLWVKLENKSSTEQEDEDYVRPTSDRESSRSLLVVTVVVLPFVLLVATLPWFVWCLLKSKDKQQQPPHQSSNPTIQETVEAPNNVPAASLVYSVLDFPKRPPTVLEMNSRDTEYAAVSYLTEKRHM